VLRASSITRIVTVIACAAVAIGTVPGCSERACVAGGPPSKSANVPAEIPAAPAVKPALRRWAVICSQEAQQAGLNDLATAELSKVKDLELVERERLDAVTKELQLASALESQAVAARLRIGRLLKADALLLCNVEEIGKAQVLRIVVADCLYGARLRIEFFAYDQSKLPDLSKRCAEIVGKVSEQFAGGIRQIVGVSPFMSKNLVHDYDALQAAFAMLLEAGIIVRPNTAVIEIEEARAIGREMGLTGSAVLDRPTPLLVEGEFNVARGGKGQSGLPMIQFELTCRASGGNRRVLRPPSMPLSTAARYLVSDLPRRILSPNDGPVSRTVSMEEQSQWLIARGDAFAQVGAWEQSTELLEAAVLLLPDDVVTRLKLLANYESLLSLHSARLAGRPEQAVRAGAARLIEARLAYIRHLEYLIRNRLLDADQAIAAFCGRSPVRSWPRYFNSAGALRSCLSLQEQFQLMIEAEERFVVDVYPLVLQLPARSPRNPKEFSSVFIGWRPGRGDSVYEEWLDGLLRWFLKERAVPRVPTRHDLDFLYRILTELVPERCGPPDGLGRFLITYRGIPSDTHADRAPESFTEDEWLVFLGRLTASKNRMANLCGRYGLLHLKWHEIYSKRDFGKSAESLLAEIDAWREDYKAAVKSISTHKFESMWGLSSQVGMVRHELVNELNRPKTAFASSASRNSHYGSVFGTDPLAHSAAAKLKFEEIAVPGSKESGFDGLLACGDEGDVAWQSNRMVLFTKSGARHEYSGLPDGVSQVYWDGRQIWIATSHGEICVLSLDGKLLDKIGADQGLPPAGIKLVLRVLAPGKVCAAGSFGEQHRAWCAIVELATNGSKVNVFHQATHVARNFAATVDPQTAFVPSDFCDYDPHNGKPRLLILPRNMSYSGGDLAIDPATLEVSVKTDREYRFPAYVVCYTNSKAEILGVRRGDGRVEQLARPGTVLDDGKRSRPLSVDFSTTGLKLLTDRVRLLGGSRSGSANDKGMEVEGTTLIKYRNALYVPGNTGAIWFRIDPETFRAEAVDPGPSQPGKYCWYTVSNCYGLVGGRRPAAHVPGRFFRVNVEELLKNDAPGTGDGHDSPPSQPIPNGRGR
jgi:hypothetical protein